MTVSSLPFLAWMIGGVCAHWATPRAHRPWTHAALGLAFVAVHARESLIPLVLLTGVAWAAARPLYPPRRAVVISVAVILAVFAVYKLRASSWLPLAAVPVPLGLSFYAIRCVHYVVERSRRPAERDPENAFPAFLAYTAFLPSILAGPIHRQPSFSRDLHGNRFDADGFSRGLERIIFGYAKVVLVANYLVSEAFAAWIQGDKVPVPFTTIDIGGLHGEPLAVKVWLESLRYGLNLYFQFAGYSDIAIGFSRLMGVRIIENFDWPLVRTSIAGFWRGWHISLATMAREMIYLPVLARTRVPQVAALSTMLAIGFWHEPTGRYLAWGLYHGVGLAVWQGFQRLKPRLPAPAPAARIPLAVLSWFLTFQFVTIGFSLTRADDLRSGLRLLRMMATGW